MKIIVGCDHAGLELKLQVMAALDEFQWQDVGTHSKDSTDYPDFADKVCGEIIKASNNKTSDTLGLLICGSGQGMAIRANRYPEIRAALCWTKEVAQVSREHNNANILCLGSRFTTLNEAIEMVRVFATTSFEGGRHLQRVNKLGQKLSTDTGC